MNISHLPQKTEKYQYIFIYNSNLFKIKYFLTQSIHRMDTVLMPLKWMVIKQVLVNLLILNYNKKHHSINRLVHIYLTVFQTHIIFAPNTDKL